MRGEEWRPVVGYEGYYEVSDQGRVRSIDRTYVRPHPTSPTGFQIVRQRGRLRRLAEAKAGGYLVVTLFRDAVRGGATKHVHRLVMDAFVGPKPDDMEVRHLDGDPLNARLGNLSYSTHSVNISDKRAHGTDHNANKTRCPSNHPYDDENTYVLPSRPNARYCRACARDRKRSDGLRAG